VIEMLRRYWLEVRFVFVYNILLLVVLSLFVFFVGLLMMEWSPDKIEILINMYSSFPYLYNCKLSDYHNKTKRSVAVTEIANAVGMSGNLDSLSVIARSTFVMICHYFSMNRLRATVRV